MRSKTTIWIFTITATVLFVSCSISEKKRSSIFEKRLYSKGYHFKGLKGNEKGLKRIEESQNYSVSEFRPTADEDVQEFKNTVPRTSVEKSNSEVFVDERELNETLYQQRKSASSEYSKYKQYSVQKALKILQGDTVRTKLKITEEEKRKTLKQIRRSYLFSAILGGIALFFFWTIILMIGFAILSFALALVGTTKERQLNKDGVKTDEFSLNRIEKLVPAIPLIFWLSLAFIIGGGIALLFGIAGFTGLLILGTALVIIGGLAFLATLVLGLILLVNLIRKAGEFKELDRI